MSVSSNTSEKKQIKVFNKVYIQLQDAVKVSLKKMNSKTYKINKIEQLHQFATEIETHLELFKNKDQELLTKVKLLADFFADKPLLSKANVEVVWKFIEVMVSIVKKSKSTELTVPSAQEISSLESLVSSLMTDENSGFKSIVDDISAQLEASMKGKDLDQSKIINDLLSGNLTTAGIDFGEIIKNTTKHLEQKVETGEVDINSLKQTSDKIANITGLKH